MASKKTDYTLKMALLRRLFGGKCVKCGATDRLEFDHVNPATKLFSVSVGWSSRWDVLLRELAKCQLLCRQCHLRKTYPDITLPVPLGHGSKYKYSHGCRCRECQDGQSARSFEYYHRKNPGSAYGTKPTVSHPHGARGRYRQGCRCSLCRSAQAEYQRTFRSMQ